MGLTAIADHIPGKLTIVIDQGEEIFTKAVSRGEHPERSFFRFLEQVYRRDLDVRVVIALRTEYYGRFRDALGLADRSIVAPGRSGIEPYMLHSLRDKDRLRTVLLLPTRRDLTFPKLAGRSATASGGEEVEFINPSQKYGFDFAPELPDRIVNDLLQIYPDSSILPPLQLVGAKLYREYGSGPEQRRIEYEHYNKVSGVTGVVDSYIEDGLKKLRPIQHPRTYKARNIFNKLENIGRLRWLEPETTRWRRVLCSLVGRQGGGTVVSLAATEHGLIQKAKEQGLFGELRSCLLALTSPPYPLLRANQGDERKTGTEFSLHHDTVALALDRWREGEDKVRTKDRVIRQLRIAIVGASALILGLIFYYFEATNTSRQVENSLSRMDAIALDSGPDFRRRLLILRASLLASGRPKGLVQRWRLPVRHNTTLSYLKKALLRAPAFGGKFDAIGMDQTATKLALLDGDIVQMYKFSEQHVSDPATAFAVPEMSSIPSGEKSASSLLRQAPPAVGFLGDLGVVAFKEGMLFFWRENKAESLDLAELLPEGSPGQTFGPVLVEFDADALQMTISTRPKFEESQKIETNFRPPEQPLRELYVFRLTSAAIGKRPLTRWRWVDAEKVRVPLGPPPMFSQRKNSEGALPYAEVSLAAVKPENKTVDLAPQSSVSASPESEEQEVDLDVHFTDPSRPGSQITTELMTKEAHPRTIFGPPPRPYVVIRTRDVDWRGEARQSDLFPSGGGDP
jgi:hypothetical protein